MAKLWKNLSKVEGAYYAWDELQSLDMRDYIGDIDFENLRYSLDGIAHISHLDIIAIWSPGETPIVAGVYQLENFMREDELVIVYGLEVFLIIDTEKKRFMAIALK